MNILSIVVLSAVFGIFTINEAYGDAIHPLVQVHMGIPPNEVVCNEDLVKLVDSEKNRVICVKESSVEIFAKGGWERLSDSEPSVAEIKDTIKTISIIKTESIGVKKSSTSIYDYVFEVCAGSVTLVAPEILVRTDLDTKSITLSQNIPANSCRISYAVVTAVNAESIKATLTNQDDIVSKISSINDDLNSLNQKLETEKQTLASILLEQNNDEKKMKIGESTTKISSLRQTINDLRDDLARYNLVLHGQKIKTDLAPKTSFTGTKISENHVKVISALPSKTKGIWDVVLEVCAGKESISDPIIKVTSDAGDSTLNLTKISANSCYKTGAKIKATSSSSVSLKFSDTTFEIIRLQELIKDMEEKLATKRNEIADLTNSANPDPKKIHIVTNEITSLREDIVRAKSSLYQNIYVAYRN